jgi:hypothetical protein
MGWIRTALRLVALALLAVAMGTRVGWAETGVVALRVSGCDYYLIRTNNGYVVAEWYGDYDPSKGDFVAGALSQYGMKTLFFGAGHEEGQTYIEDFWLDGDNAVEQLSDQCG